MRKLPLSLLVGAFFLGCGRSDVTLHEVVLSVEEQQVVTVVEQLFKLLTNF